MTIRYTLHFYSVLGLAILIVVSPLSWAKAAPPQEIKADSLRHLQQLRTENTKHLRDIDATLSRKIEESPARDLEKDVSALRFTKREYVLRQEFLDRLIFQIDTKFYGDDLRGFLERALTDMAKVDAISAQAGLWKFLKFAADAVRIVPEKKENILAFLEGYMNRSIADPIRPEDYLNSRNYTNGARSESGAPVARDEVGDVADRRLQESKQTE